MIWWTRRRVHPAYLLGLGVVVALCPLYTLLAATPLVRAIVADIRRPLSGSAALHSRGSVLYDAHEPFFAI
jgi:hypothetical protein